MLLTELLTGLLTELAEIEIFDWFWDFWILGGKKGKTFCRTLVSKAYEVHLKDGPRLRCACSGRTGWRPQRRTRTLTYTHLTVSGVGSRRFGWRRTTSGAHCMAIVVVGWARSAGRATYNVTMYWRAKTTTSRPDQKKRRGR